MKIDMWLNTQLQRIHPVLSVAAVCFITTILTTWPLVATLTTTIPLGTETEATVPLFNLWSLWWTADRAMHGFSEYWNAPFFFPTQGVFTFSEPQLLTGIAVAPLWWLGLPPALIYNVTFLGLLILNGIFAYRLASALLLPALPAHLSIVLIITLPFIAKVGGVLQLVALFGMLWTIEGLVQFGRNGAVCWAVWAAVGFVVTYLTCQQYALMFALFAAGAGLIALNYRRFEEVSIIRLVVAGLVAGITVLLVALPAIWVHNEMGFQRADEVVRALSARPEDFFSRPETSLLTIPPLATTDTAGLFPGIMLTFLAFVGVIIGLREPIYRGWSIYFITTISLAVLLALGLHVDIFGWSPYRILRAFTPGFNSLRSPFRYAALFQVYLPILAAITLNHLKQRTGFKGNTIIIILAVVAALENLALPNSLTSIPISPRTSWTVWLQQHPDAIVVAHVPFPDGLQVKDYEIETWRLFAQIDHHKQIVNGYSGYFPRSRGPLGETTASYTLFQLAMAQQFPNEQLLCIMKVDLGVDMVIIDKNWAIQNKKSIDAFGTFLHLNYQDGQVAIYELIPPKEFCY